MTCCGQVPTYTIHAYWEFEDGPCDEKKKEKRKRGTRKYAVFHMLDWPLAYRVPGYGYEFVDDGFSPCFC